MTTDAQRRFIKQQGLYHQMGVRKFKEWCMANGKKDLADSGNREKFVRMLEKAEKFAGNLLNNWESEFVSQMRGSFETREDAFDLGVTPWNPTVNQWNTLHGIVSKL